MDENVRPRDCYREKEPRCRLFWRQRVRRSNIVALAFFAGHPAARSRILSVFVADARRPDPYGRAKRPIRR